MNAPWFVGTLRRAIERGAAILLLAALVPSLARAQAADSTAAPVDSVTAAPAPAPAAPPPVRPARASWLSDRMPLRVGDLVTVVVDEQTAATEHVQSIATGNRSQRADLNAAIGTDARVGPAKSFGTGMTSGSRDVGDAGRTADFTAVMTVRIVELSANGVARIAGEKKVDVDGRLQDIVLSGSVRAEDVDARNRVRSEDIADAVIRYKGKKIGPRTGILGSILGMLWP